MRLQRRHLHPQYPLALRRETRQHVALQPPQHEALELLVERLDLLLVVGIAEVELVGELDCVRLFVWTWATGGVFVEMQEMGAVYGG